MRRFWMIGLGVVALIVSIVAVSSLNRPTVGLDSAEAANAMQQAAGGVPKIITVVGQGKVTVKPDMAETSIGVRATGATVAEATGKANKDMDSVLKALKAAGCGRRALCLSRRRATTGHSAARSMCPASGGRPACPCRIVLYNSPTTRQPLLCGPLCGG